MRTIKHVTNHSAQQRLEWGYDGNLSIVQQGEPPGKPWSLKPITTDTGETTIADVCSASSENIDTEWH